MSLTRQLELFFALVYQVRRGTDPISSQGLTDLLVVVKHPRLRARIEEVLGATPTTKTG